jgi:hypothetical protein
MKKRPTPRKAESSALNMRKFSSRSTSTEAQIQRLLGLIKTRPHHTHELRKFGISHPAGRIQDLERRGYVFDASRITTIDSDGYAHHGVALYTLLDVPKGCAS